MAEGKRSRKFGRNRDRSPSMKRYKAEDRYLKNKRRRIERTISNQPNNKALVRRHAELAKVYFWR